MGILATTAIMAYIAAVIVGLYKIAPKWIQEEIQDFLQRYS